MMSLGRLSMRVRPFVIASLMLLVAAVAAQDAAKVESFSPQGQVAVIGQRAIGIA